MRQSMASGTPGCKGKGRRWAPLGRAGLKMTGSMMILRLGTDTLGCCRREAIAHWTHPFPRKHAGTHMHFQATRHSFCCTLHTIPYHTVPYRTIPHHTIPKPPPGTYQQPDQYSTPCQQPITWPHAMSQTSNTQTQPSLIPQHPPTPSATRAPPAATR